MRPPSAFSIGSCRSRATTSTPEPAGKPIRMGIGCAGQLCASARTGHSSRRKRRRVMALLSTPNNYDPGPELMIERLPEVVNVDPAIVRWGREMNETFMLEVGDVQYLITVRAGHIEKVEKGAFVTRSWRFAIRASRECWEQFWRSPPAPGWHDLFALLRRGEVKFEGDQRTPWAYLLYLKLALAALRR